MYFPWAHMHKEYSINFLYIFHCRLKPFYSCTTVLPSATITPLSISVNEGDPVRLVCDVMGSEPLNVSWTLTDGSSLPLGVQENGTELVFAAANSSHPGTYVCSVSNVAGTSRDEANVTVYRKYSLV